MPNLDGKDVIKPTPFDAHEQVVRSPHTHSLTDGYQKAEEPEQAEEAEKPAEAEKAEETKKPEEKQAE